MHSALTHKRLIARHPKKEFWLYELLPRSERGWLNLWLVASTRRRKRNWRFGWNGEVLSRSHDARMLLEHEPDIYEWVWSKLEFYWQKKTGHSATLLVAEILSWK
jgi:hypothetical protein